MVYFESGEWPVSYVGTGCSVFTDSDDSGDSGNTLQADCEEMAANLLWNWTNRIFGSRREIVRPTRVKTPWRPSTFEGLGPPAAYYDLGSIPGYGFLPLLGFGGSWLEFRCGECGMLVCSHADPRAIHLPGPVQDVNAIDIGGLLLDPSAYRVDNGHTLIRQDGQSWPTRQDLYASIGTPNTWTIDFDHGVPVPMGGQLAAGLLACELAKAMSGDGDCALPSRVQSVTRQGVSMDIVQTTFQDAQDGRTGIFTIDSWIGSVTTPRDYVGVSSPETRRGMGAGWSVGSRR